MLRPAKTTDVFILADILADRAKDSRYALKLGQDALIEPKLARTMFAQAVQRHGGTNDGATFVMVHETDGQIDAFILAGLGRIYEAGTQLAASDTLLLGIQGCDPRAMTRLLEAYVEWAEANPKVMEVGLSWSDTIPGSDILVRKFERDGFVERSRSFFRPNPNFAAPEAERNAA